MPTGGKGPVSQGQGLRHCPASRLDRQPARQPANGASPTEQLLPDQNRGPGPSGVWPALGAWFRARWEQGPQTARSTPRSSSLPVCMGHTRTLTVHAHTLTRTGTHTHWQTLAESGMQASIWDPPSGDLGLLSPSCGLLDSCPHLPPLHPSVEPSSSLRTPCSPQARAPQCLCSAHVL